MSTRLACVAMVSAAPLASWNGDQLAVVERRQDVAVHRDEGSVEIGDDPKRAGRAERLVLPVPAQLELVRQACRLGEVDLDQLAQMADAEVDRVDARGVQTAEDVLEDRPVADRDERLGQDRRVRPQAHAEAPRQDHRSVSTRASARWCLCPAAFPSLAGPVSSKS